MSTTVDSEVVKLTFDNKQFEEGCKESMSTLDKLKAKIQDSNSSTGLKDLSKSAENLDLSKVEKSIESVNKKFSVLGVIGATAISEITKSAMSMAKTLITTVPNIIKEGGWTRAMNIEQAKFQLEGLGITWSRVGQQISNAVSGTAYSMDSAAKAASQLAASGIEITGVGDQMETTLKAISGVAAQTNSTYDEIANIFTTVAGNGRLMGDQLRQLSYRGMNAAAALGEAMGITESEVRDMVSKGEISFKQFSDIMYETFGENAFKANQTFSGSLDNMKAALKRTGEAFAGPIQRQMIPVFNSLRQAINRANNEIFKFSSNNVNDQSVIQDSIKETEQAISDLDEAFKNGKITREEYREQSKALNATLKDQKQALVDCYGPFEKFAYVLQEKIVKVINKINFGFLDNVMNGLVNILKAGYSVIKPFANAFSELFGISLRNYNIALSEFARNFEKFTEKLILSETEMAYLKNTVRGILSVFELFTYILKSIVSAITGVEINSVNLREVLLSITSVVGDILTIFTRVIKQTDIVRLAFKGLATVLSLVAGLFVTLVSKIYDFIVYVKKLEIVQVIFNAIRIAIQATVGVIMLAVTKIRELFTELKKGNLQVLGVVGEAIEFIKNGIMFLVAAIAELINKVTQLEPIVKVVDKIKSAFSSLKDTIGSIFGNSADEISDTTEEVVTITDEMIPLAGEAKTAGSAIENLTNRFKTFTSTLQEATKGITVAKIIGVAFAASLVLIAYKTSDAFQAFASGVKSVGKAMSTFTKKGIIGMIWGSREYTPNKILDMAVVIGVLTAALVAFSKIPTDNLDKAGATLLGLAAGFTGLMYIITVIDNLSVHEGGIKIASLSLLAIAGSIAILTIALRNIASMKEGVLGAIGGITVLTALLTGMAIALSRFAKEYKLGTMSLVGMAMAIRILVKALQEMSQAEINTEGLLEKIKYLSIVAVVLAGTMRLLGGVQVALLTFTKFVTTMLLVAAGVAIIIKVLDTVKWNRLYFRLKEIKRIFGEIPGVVLTVATAAISVVGLVTILQLIPKLIQAICQKIIGTGPSIAKAGLTLGDGLAYISKALSKFGTAAIILSLTATIVALAALAAILSKADYKEMWKGISLVAGLAAIVAGLAWVSKLTEKAKPSALLASVVAIGAILAEIQIMALMIEGDLVGTLTGLGGMLIIIGLYSGVLLALSKVKLYGNSYKGIVAATVGLVSIVGALVVLTQYANFDQIIPAVLALTSVMAAMTIMLQQLGETGMSFAKGKLVAIAEGIGSIIAIAGSLTLLSRYAQSTSAIIAAAAGIALVMGVFTKMIKDLGSSKIDKSIWNGILGIVITVVAIAGALTGLTMYAESIDKIFAAAAGLSIVMGVFTTMTLLLAKMQNGTQAFLMLLGVAIVAGSIAGSLALLCNYDWKAIDKAVGMMSTIMIGLTVMSAIFTALAATGFGEVATLMIVGLAASFAALAIGISVLANALTNLLPVLSQFVSDILNTLISAKDEYIKISMGLAALGTSLMVVGAAGLVLMLGSGGLIVAGMTLPAIAAGMSMLANVNFAAMNQGLAELVPKLLQFGIIGAGLALTVPYMLATAAGLTILAASVGLAIRVMGTDSIEPLKDSPKELTLIGKNTVLGFANGLEDSATWNKVRTIAANLAKLVPSIIRTTLGIHSPSTETASDGKNTILGYAGGLDDQAIWNAMSGDLSGNLGNLTSMMDISTEAENAGGTAAYKFGKSINDNGIWYTIKNSFANNLRDLTSQMNWFSGFFPEWSSKINKWANKVVAENKKNIKPVTDAAHESALAANEAKNEQIALRKSMRETAKEADNTTDSLDDLDSVLDGIGGSGGGGGSASAATESIEDLSSAFESLSSTSGKTMKEMVGTMASNLNKTYQWAQDMRLLVSRGYDEATVEWVKSMGVSGHKTVRALITASEEEAALYKALIPKWLSLDEDASAIIAGTYEQAGQDAWSAFNSAFGMYDSEFADSVQGAVDPFSEFNKEINVTSAELIKNMQSQISGVSEWAEMIGQLADRGINEELLQYLKDMGPAGYQYVAAFAKMTDNEFQNANNLWQQTMDIGVNAAKTVYPHEMNLIGQNMAQGLVNGLDPEAAKSQGIAFGQAGVDGTAEGAGTHSPSWKTFDIGRYMMLGLKNGIEKNAWMAIQEANRQSVKVIQAFGNYLNEDKGHKLGGDIIQGIINGIKDREKDLFQKAWDVAYGAWLKAKEAVQSNSPSKRFMQLGRDMDEGLVIGIGQSENRVYNAVESMALTSVDAMNDAMNSLTNTLTVSDEFSPVITPRLDLSNIQNGKRTIGEMFGSGQGLALAHSISARMTGININGSSVIPVSGGNGDVVNAINQLRSDLGTVMDSVSQMQVVLDGGALVGELAGPIDNALGQRAVRAGRRN